MSFSMPHTDEAPRHRLVMHRWIDTQEVPPSPGDTYKRHRIVGRPHATVTIRVPDPMVRLVYRVLCWYWARRK